PFTVKPPSRRTGYSLVAADTGALRTGMRRTSRPRFLPQPPAISRGRHPPRVATAQGEPNRHDANNDEGRRDHDVLALYQLNPEVCGRQDEKRELDRMVLRLRSVTVAHAIE